MSSEVEVVLPRRVVPQPAPAIVPGGDCAACCLAGVLDLTIREVYELRGKPPQALSWWCTRETLEAALMEGLVDEIVTTVPVWIDAPTSHLTWGLTSLLQAHGWIDYLRLALGAGFYAITSIDFEQRGHLGETGHAVLLCGLRRRWVPAALPGCQSLKVEVLMSCSASGDQWVDAREFLEWRGGFALLLARPAS